MSEMLGNHYFIARQFDKAAKHLEDALTVSQHADQIKKKLVICYIQIGQIEKALHYFYELVKKNPQIIIDTDPYWDDCPCYEIIPELENKKEVTDTLSDYALILGMLYLYCDVQKSIDYLKDYPGNQKNNRIIQAIIKKLSELDQVV